MNILTCINLINIVSKKRRAKKKKRKEKRKKPLQKKGEGEKEEKIEKWGGPLPRGPTDRTTRTCPLVTKKKNEKKT